MTIQHINIGPGTEPKVSRAAQFAAARAGTVAIDDDTGAIYAFDNRQVKALLIDKRLVGGARAIFEMQDIPAGPLPDWYRTIMFTTEGPEHSRLRRLVGKAFTPRAIEGLREIAAALVEERLGNVRADGGGDLMTALADVPMHLMCALTGVPSSDVPEFIEWLNNLGPVFGFMTPAQIAAATSAISGILAYSLDLRDRRHDTPGADLMSELIAAEDDGDRLTREETAAMVANLLIGGHDTTSSQIGCTVLTMLTRPQIMAEVRADPEILASVVSESIRLEPSIAASGRVALEPVDIGGLSCPAGSVIFPDTMTAGA